MIFTCESFTEGLIPEMFDRMATGGSEDLEHEVEYEWWQYARARSM
jgi:hypothetical protein